MAFRVDLSVVTADSTAVTVIMTVYMVHRYSYPNSTFGLALCYPYRINILELLVLLDLLSGNMSSAL